MIKCPNCDRQNAEHFKFCLGCGAKLPAAAPSQPAAAPQQDFGTAGTGEHPSMGGGGGAPGPGPGRF